VEAHSVSVLAIFVLLGLLTWVLLETNIIRGSIGWRRSVDRSVGGHEWFVGLPARGGDGGGGSWTRGSVVDLLDVGGGEETLFSVDATGPPVGICFLDEFDDIA
jgi:hypothetical protein